MKKYLKPIILLACLIFLYIGIIYCIYCLAHPTPSNIVDVEISHDARTDHNIVLLAEYPNGKREILASSLLLKNKVNSLIQFKKPSNQPMKIYLVTDKDSNLIFDNTEGGADA